MGAVGDVGSVEFVRVVLMGSGFQDQCGDPWHTAIGPLSIQVCPTHLDRDGQQLMLGVYEVDLVQHECEDRP